MMNTALKEDRREPPGPPASAFISANASHIGPFHDHQRKLFEKVLKLTLDGQAEGVLTPFLFWEPQPFEKGTSADLRILGAQGWDTFTSETRDKSGFRSNDSRIIRRALSEGLLNLDIIPSKISALSYGGGDQQTYKANEGQILRAIANSPDHEVTRVRIVDIMQRYISENTMATTSEINTPVDGILFDFLRDDQFPRMAEARGETMLMSFGGTLFNAPRFVMPDESRTDPIDEFTNVWTRMNTQHGVGALAVFTHDTQLDPKKLAESYAIEKRSGFDAFLLGAWGRAVQQGIILDKNYSPFENWTTANDIRETDNGVNVDLLNIAKRDHSIETTFGTYKIEKGQRFVVTISGKWREEVVDKALEDANWRIRETYKEDGNPNRLIVAQGRKPQNSFT